jgi:hypothetical protein
VTASSQASGSSQASKPFQVSATRKSQPSQPTIKATVGVEAAKPVGQPPAVQNDDIKDEIAEEVQVVVKPPVKPVESAAALKDPEPAPLAKPATFAKPAFSMKGRTSNNSNSVANSVGSGMTYGAPQPEKQEAPSVARTS